LLLRAANQAHLRGADEMQNPIWNLCLQNLQMTSERSLRKAPPDHFSADSARSKRSACCWWHLSTCQLHLVGKLSGVLVAKTGYV
jgi:hypothetical protein